MDVGVSRRVALVVAVVATTLAALVGATIASSSPAAKVPSTNPLAATLAQLKGLKPAERTQKLADLAKAEGQVTIYTSLSALVTRGMTSAWAAEYPDVKLNLYRASSEDVTARLLAEVSANTKGADIFETNGTNMLIMQHKRNVLIPYRGSPWAGTIPKAYRFDSFTADRLEKFAVTWNTNIVKDPPKSFQDLTNSKWKGQLSLEPTDQDWFATLDEYFTTQAKPRMTEAAFLNMFKAIAANAKIVNGHTNQQTLLAAGQYGVTVTGHGQAAEQLMAQKAPLTFGPPFVTPVIERPQGMGIPYTVEHPAAALLFYDWMLRGATPDGKIARQKVLLANGVQPANPYYQDDAFKSKPLTIKMDLRPIVENYQKWTKLYESVLSGAQK